jgi:RNA polymerase sigma-70 factor (ECF subfamily)
MRNQGQIYAFILALMPNRHDADDIMQETVTLMWRKFDSFKQGTNFSAWGRAVARNRIMKFFDRHRRSRVRFSDELLRAIEKQTESSLDQMDRFVSALRECVEKLEETDRRVIRMRYEQEVPTKQIADLLGSSIHATYRSMARIHRTLERCIRRAVTREGLA